MSRTWTFEQNLKQCKSILATQGPIILREKNYTWCKDWCGLSCPSPPTQAGRPHGRSSPLSRHSSSCKTKMGALWLQTSSWSQMSPTCILNTVKQTNKKYDKRFHCTSTSADSLLQHFRYLARSRQGLPCPLSLATRRPSSRPAQITGLTTAT